MNSNTESLITEEGITSPVSSASIMAPAKKMNLSPSLYSGLILILTNNDSNGIASNMHTIERRIFCLASRSVLISVVTRIKAPAAAETVYKTFLGFLSLHITFLIRANTLFKSQ